ncbi:MAG: OmpA family protein [Limnothrix sp. CACIAM 69d]|nr:MAG: OmpA family protein [Limnothrix sp. CACIAM 69d]
MQSPFELPPTPDPQPNRNRSRRPGRPPARSPRSGPWGWIATLLRLALLLGLGIAGVLGGVAAARWVPGTITSTPPLELALRQLDQWLTRWPRSPGPLALPPATIPSPSPTLSASPVPANPLSPDRRKALQTQLQALEADLNALIGEATAIEGELGNRNPTGPIEQRVQAIAQALNSTESTPRSAPSPTRSTPTQAAGRLTIALPTDLLFQDNHSNLQPAAGAILDTIAADLQNYPGATVRIAGHSDAIGDPVANRELTLRRAKAVGQYLADRLTGPYRWVTAGFGASRPLTPDPDPASQQRNRRIEIVIEPLMTP